jgi:signal transduction histidine kinase
MDKRLFWSRTAFVVAAGLILGVAVLYLYNIIKWGDLIDFGFYRRTATGVKVVGVVTEIGRKAGIQVGDHILNVNGKEFSSYKEFVSFLHREPGEKNAYLLKRSGKEFEVSITNTRLGVGRAFVRSGLPYVVGLCYVFIGSLVFLMKPHQRATWIFFLFAGTFGLYLTFMLKLGELTPLWLGTIHILLYVFSPAVIIHLTMTFPGERRFIRKSPFVQFFPYLASTLLFLAMGYTTTEMIDVPKTLRLVASVYLTSSILLFIGSCLQLCFTSPSEMVKVRSKMILLGTAIAASVPLSETVINAVFRVFIIPSFNYYLPFLIVFPLSIGYSIVKHNLFDIDATIRRTFGYALLTIGIAVLYTLSVFVPPLSLVGFKLTESTIFPLFFALAMVFLFTLLRGRIQKTIDRIFYRIEYDYDEAVEKISENMRSLLTLEEIGKSMMETVFGVLFAEKGSVMILNEKDQRYEAVAGTLTNLRLSASDPLIQKIAERKKEVTLYDIEEDPFYRTNKEACTRTFKGLEATLIIPLAYETNLIGLLSLGSKRSGKFYRRIDINLLKILANQGTLAIENARLHQARLEALENSRKELERLNRAKSIAIQHLSHELRTPIAVIKGSLQLLRRRLQAAPSLPGEDKSFDLVEKQLNRLMDIQSETDKIIGSYEELELERIRLYFFAGEILEKVKQKAAHRDIQFLLEGEKDLSLKVAPAILEEILEGLLKNAIENTPDEGLIRVVVEQKAQWIQLKVQDFGVGISEENQRYLFDGLFHTLDTELYTSGKPYHFGAGGKGLNLFRIKTYGQRLGYEISAGSQRCVYLPTDSHLCPGKISACTHCKRIQDCLSSGGSTFCISFPVMKQE